MKKINKGNKIKSKLINLLKNSWIIWIKIEIKKLKNKLKKNF